VRIRVGIALAAVPQAEQAESLEAAYGLRISPPSMLAMAR
jgi:hypothetical protein